MCQSPYDYQGPVANSPAAYGQRQNSAFANGSMAPQPMGMAAAPPNSQSAPGANATVDTGADIPPVANAQTAPAQRY
jgi:hypothetical protein